ncbi:MAG: ferredoxin--NADP reductase [Gemmataceae bacterium]
MSPEQIAELRQSRYNATVLQLDRVHSDLMKLRVKPDFPRPVHQAGQYCSLGLGYWEPRVAGCQEENLKPEDLTKIVLRAYSLSNGMESSPGVLRNVAAEDFVEFYIVLVRSNADGRVPALTPRLFALETGSRLKMFEKITGKYTLEGVQPTDNVVFLGTGTGEAPHNYMLWELLQRGHTGRIVSACCVRLKQDLGYLETHERLMDQYKNYRYMALTTRESGVPKRYIQDVVLSGQLEDALQAKLSPTNTHVFLCGNPAMIGVPKKNAETGVREYPTPTGVIELLEQRGLIADQPTAKLRGNIHFEEYW